MTLATAFIRKLPRRSDREELVFASDSCLSGGQRFDQGPKIFPLPRSDALFCFAGDTYYAYPLAIHLATAIASYPRSSDRRFPLERAVQHACRIFEQSFRLIHHTPSDGRPIEADATFVFGGFSWHDDAFRMWKISIDRDGRTFPLTEIHERHVFIGTTAAIPDAEARFQALLAANNRNVTNFDMEPFEALRDIVRARTYSDIGGTPQIAKVFRHMNTQFFSTLWPDADETIRPHAFGRPLHPWEQTTWPRFDPDRINFNAQPPR